MTTFITPVVINTTGITASTWTAYNLASYGVPSGATGVMLNFAQPVGHSGASMARMHGSTDSFVTTTLGSTQQMFLAIGVDASQNVDIYLADVNCTVYLLGYFGSEAVFFTNATALTAVTTSYTSYNLASSCPSGIAAFLFVDAAYGVAFRKNGSTDDFENVNELTSRKGFIVGLDSSQVMNGIGQSSQVPQLLGYMRSGITWNLNAITRTPGSAGSFQSLATEASAVGYLYQLYDVNASGYTFTVREIGYSAYNPAMQGTGGSGSAQNVAGNPAEVNISNTALAVLELGYFTGVTVGPATYSLTSSMEF